MDVNTKIFIYYSKKSPLPDDVEKVIGEMKDAIKKREWIVLDPMTEPGVDSISDKVKRDLLDADSIFAEITMGVPNVLFEVGFGHALGCPIVTFVNSSAFGGLNTDWNLYFELIKQDKKRPLPSDLGDVEYFQYSSDDIRLPGARKSLRKRMDGLLAKLGETTLTQGACLLRSNYKRLLTLTQEL